MPRSHPTRSLRPWRTARVLAAMAVATGVAAAPAAAALALPSGPAGTSRHSGRVPGPSLSLEITSLSPGYATPGNTVSVSGTVHNGTPYPMTGAVVNLLSSTSAFRDRGTVESYALGSASYLPALSPVGPATTITAIAPGKSARWTIALPAKALGVSCFGVFPLTAQVTVGYQSASAALPLTLPFWPGSHSHCQGRRPAPEQISWIWPLIDRPHQDACPDPVLADNSLATSLAPDGRLGRLLAAGARYGTAARITWFVDPELLASASQMTGRYRVSTRPSCTGQSYPRSAAARNWLGQVRRVVASHAPVVVTPYADVDVAALTAHGLAGDLGAAFSSGRQVAASMLGPRFASVPSSAQSDQLSSVAWPADGVANYYVLEYLAAQHVSTVILDNQTMQPVDTSLGYTPGAVTSTPDGSGSMRVLLYDDLSTQLLRSPFAKSRQPASQLVVSQLFLAETAMFVAQAPTVARPLLIAPPRSFSPAGHLAERLLAETASAPWLKPTSLSDLLTAPDHGGPRLYPPTAVSAGQLPGRLLRGVARLDRQVQMLSSVRCWPASKPGRCGPSRMPLQLRRATFAIESSAWRGRTRAATALLRTSSKYVADQLSQVSIHSATKVTLGGMSGTVPVSVDNRLHYPIQVRVSATPLGKGLRLSGFGQLVTVPAGSVVTVPHINVQTSSTGTTAVVFRLLSPSGARLPSQPLRMQIDSTHLGSVVLILGAILLGLFVMTSALRAMRRDRPGPAGADASAQDGSGGPGGPDDREGGPARSDPVERASQVEQADNVVPGGSDLPAPGAARGGP